MIYQVRGIPGTAAHRDMNAIFVAHRSSDLRAGLPPVYPVVDIPDEVFNLSTKCSRFGDAANAVARTM